jgi:hypothetical protein
VLSTVATTESVKSMIAEMVLNPVPNPTIVVMVAGPSIGLIKR